MSVLTAKNLEAWILKECNVEWVRVREREGMHVRFDVSVIGDEARVRQRMIGCERMGERLRFMPNPPVPVGVVVEVWPMTRFDRLLVRASRRVTGLLAIAFDLFSVGGSFAESRARD